jgi:hypothetical protein
MPKAYAGIKGDETLDAVQINNVWVPKLEIEYIGKIIDVGSRNLFGELSELKEYYLSQESVIAVFSQDIPLISPDGFCKTNNGDYNIHTCHGLNFKHDNETGWVQYY